MRAPDGIETMLRHAAVVAMQHRYALGIDTRDWPLYRSVFADEVAFDFTAWHGGAPATMAADEWVARVVARQSGFDGTQHQMSNHAVTSTPTGVRCLTYIVARHYLCIDGDHHVQAIGGYYTNELVCHDGSWKIAACKLSVLWTTGDRALFDVAAARWSARQ